ncbi:MAG: DUF3327 domain-containing protein [Planctomycetes bacterium]|nr:DUF3327 domain-containing protein [Planctomycetota bacterium]
MTPAVLELQRRLGAVEPAARAALVDTFLARREVPVVEGRHVTFLWRGEADDVALVHWIYGLEQSRPFRRLPDTDLWFHALDLPEHARMEYKIAVTRSGRTDWQHDAFNPRLARDPFGANSVVHGPAYREPAWARPDADARRGQLRTIELQSTAFGDVRRVDLYLPARYRRTRRHPLLIVHDGPDYVRYAALTTILDNLIERGELPPLVVALTASPDRLVEYAADPRHAGFLCDDLLPALHRQLSLVDSPSARGLLGASFGAVAALSTAWRRPGVFGHLILQSGSFAFTDIGRHERGPIWDPVVDFVNAFRRAPGRIAEQVFVTCGTFESLVYYNRSLIPLLQTAADEVRYEEAQDGHNWENWRDRLRTALSWTFPGPLWFVYE